MAQLFLAVNLHKELRVVQLLGNQLHNFPNGVGTLTHDAVIRVELDIARSLRHEREVMARSLAVARLRVDNISRSDLDSEAREQP